MENPIAGLYIQRDWSVLLVWTAVAVCGTGKVAWVLKWMRYYWTPHFWGVWGITTSTGLVCRFRAKHRQIEHSQKDLVANSSQGAETLQKDKWLLGTWNSQWTNLSSNKCIFLMPWWECKSRMILYPRIKSNCFLSKASVLGCSKRSDQKCDMVTWGHNRFPVRQPSNIFLKSSSQQVTIT